MAPMWDPFGGDLALRSYRCNPIITLKRFDSSRSCAVDFKLMAPPSKDYYAILGVPRSATAEELRRKYKEKSLLHHPDNPLDITLEKRSDR